MATPNTQQKNFLASLFDFGFTSFVTLRFLKVIYAIMVVIILISGAFFLIAGLSTGTGVGVLAAIVFAPIFTLVYLVFARISFELIAMFFRIGDNTFLAVQLLGGKPGQQQFGQPGQQQFGQPGQYGQAPQPGYGPPPVPATPSAPANPWNYPSGAGEPSQTATTVTQYGQPSQPSYGTPDPGQGQYGQPSLPSPSGPSGSHGVQGAAGQYSPPSDSTRVQYGQPSPGAHAQGSQAGQYGPPAETAQIKYGQPPQNPAGPHPSLSKNPEGSEPSSDNPPQPGQERWGQSPSQP